MSGKTNAADQTHIEIFTKDIEIDIFIFIIIIFSIPKKSYISSTSFYILLKNSFLIIFFLFVRVQIKRFKFLRHTLWEILSQSICI